MTDSSTPTPSISALVGSTALVTGAAGGMGRAITTALAEAGATTIYALDRVATDQDGVEPVVVDLADLESVEKTVRELPAAPQVVVNAAGYYAWREGADIATSDFARTLAINLTAPFVIMREVARRLGADEEAAFVNIASIAAKRGFPNQADYVASKGGLVSLTRAAALDLAPRVTVNAIAPGTVNTPMIDQVARDIAAKTGLPFEDQRAALVTDIPTGRMQEPAEIAAAVVFLASRGARSITGETLVVDGGLSRD